MEGYMGHHQWLVSNSLLTDQMKDNIAMCGYCLVEETVDVETFIDFNEKRVQYKLLLPAKLYNNLKLLEKFENGQKLGFFESLQLKKFIKAKREHDETGMGYKLEAIGDTFIKAYLNDEWRVSVEIFKEVKNEKENFWLRDEGNQPTNG